MIPLASFECFMRRGTIRVRKPDTARAESLLEESEKRKRFLDKMLEKIDISDDNANYFIESSYDALIELIRAKMLKDGFMSSGEGAHEAEVSYMKNIGFSDNEVRFMNELRFFRNGILYYGKSFDAGYAKSVMEFLEKNFSKLLKIAKK